MARRSVGKGEGGRAIGRHGARLETGARGNSRSDVRPRPRVPERGREGREAGGVGTKA